MFQPEGKARAKSPRQERIKNVKVTVRRGRDSKKWGHKGHIVGHQDIVNVGQETNGFKIIGDSQVVI